MRVVGPYRFSAVQVDSIGVHTNLPPSASYRGAMSSQTTWAYDRAGPMGQSVFARFKIINRGPNALTDMYLSFWSDPDLGAYNDDLVGCDSTLSLGYCYNASESDAVYGAAPPAVGYCLLQGPVGSAPGVRLPLTAFFA